MSEHVISLISTQRSPHSSFFFCFLIKECERGRAFAFRRSGCRGACGEVWHSLNSYGRDEGARELQSIQGGVQRIQGRSRRC